MLRIRKSLLLFLLVGLFCHAGLAAHHDAAMQGMRIKMAALQADLGIPCDSHARTEVDSSQQGEFPAPACPEALCDGCLTFFAKIWIIHPSSVASPETRTSVAAVVWWMVAVQASRSLRPPPRGPPLQA